ncbi:hypothetical protein PG985_003804 [Apiospora marii]|uniref:uncharacterized protein n=1 Tax=Apiospora marii TaxID=335849 RepID=UPI00312D1DB8
MMSVTGATGWFRQCNNGYDPVGLQEQLKHKVFGQWPIEFIWDLRWQEGASFFSVTDVEMPSFWAIFDNQFAAKLSQLNPWTLTLETFRELLPQDPSYNIVGTLLPIDFTAWSCRKEVRETCPLRSLDYQSVGRYWTFNKEGLVDIGRAGIFASSDTLGYKADPDRPLRVHLKPFATNNVFSMTTRTEEVELREYLNNNLS